MAIAYELDLKPAMMDILSFMTETTILDNTKKAEGMVKEHVTKQMETSIQAYGMIGNDKEKLTSQTELSIDMEHTTQKIETSIQANGMVITKGKKKLTTRTELNIRDTGIGKMVVLREMDKELYTLQTDKYSTKASGTKTSIKARSNSKFYCIILKLKV